MGFLDWDWWIGQGDGDGGTTSESAFASYAFDAYCQATKNPEACRIVMATWRAASQSRTFWEDARYKGMLAEIQRQEKERLANLEKIVPQTPGTGLGEGSHGPNPDAIPEIWRPDALVEATRAALREDYLAQNAPGESEAEDAELFGGWGSRELVDASGRVAFVEEDPGTVEGSVIVGYEFPTDEIHGVAPGATPPSAASSAPSPTATDWVPPTPPAGYDPYTAAAERFGSQPVYDVSPPAAEHAPPQPNYDPSSQAQPFQQAPPGQAYNPMAIPDDSGRGVSPQWHGLAWQQSGRPPPQWDQPSDDPVPGGQVVVNWLARTVVGLVVPQGLVTGGYNEAGEWVEREWRPWEYGTTEHAEAGPQAERAIDLGLALLTLGYLGAEFVTRPPAPGLTPRPGSIGGDRGAFVQEAPRSSGAGTPGDPAAVGGPAYGSPPRVNPLGGEANCVNSAIATDATFAGRPASALPGGAEKLRSIESFFGRKAIDIVGGAQTIEMQMRSLGPGARGIVLADRAVGPGHAINVVVKSNGRVVFWDGQAGTYASLSGFRRFRLLITNP